MCLQEYSLLYEEATFFQLAPLKTELERWRAEQERRDVSRDCECVVVHVTPELGERISVSASRALMEEIFPEVNDIVYSSMNASWNQDATHLLRFPLNGYCHLTSVQVHPLSHTGLYSLNMSDAGVIFRRSAILKYTCSHFAGFTCSSSAKHTAATQSI